LYEEENQYYIMVILKKKIKSIVKQHKGLRFALLQYFGIVDHRTIIKWVDEDNPKLVMDDSLAIIEEITGIPKEILTEKVTGKIKQPI